MKNPILVLEDNIEYLGIEEFLMDNVDAIYFPLFFVK